MQLQLVRIPLGQTEHALDRLEPLLRIPFYLSPGWLRIDPTFDPLRSHPRFRKVVEGHGLSRSPSSPGRAPSGRPFS
jgi:hypothetical protein